MNLEKLNLKKLSIKESKEITGGTEPFTDADAANDHGFLSQAFRVTNPDFY